MGETTAPTGTATDLLIVLVIGLPFFAFMIWGVVWYLRCVGSVLVPPMKFALNMWFEYRMTRVRLVSTQELEEGAPARIVGRIGAIPQPIYAPLSGRECAYYKVVVERWLGDRFNTYVKMLEEERGESFVLQDGEGQIRVELSDARVLAEMDAHDASGMFNEAPPNLIAFLERHGRSSTNMLGFNRSLRYKESILGYGETIAASGTVSRRNGDLCLVDGDSASLRVSDIVGTD